MSNLTFVTGCYDLATLERNSTRRSFEQYKQYGKEILKRPVQLIVFGDEQTISYAYQERKALGLLDKTFLFHIPFETLPAYSYTSLLTDMIPRTGVNGYYDTRFSPFYLICIWSKIYFLKKASELNPFQSSSFCWIDFGYYHLREEFSYVDHSDKYFLEIPEYDTFHMVSVNAHPPSYVENASEYYKKDNYLITGQIFSGPRTLIPVVYELFMNEVKECLAIERPSPEENIFGRLVYKHPELFSLVGAYYATSLSNFAYCREFYQKSMVVGLDYAQHNLNRHAYSILDNVFQGYLKHSQPFKVQDVYNILYTLVICSYYVKREYYDTYVQHAKTFFETTGLKPDARFAKNLTY